MGQPQIQIERQQKIIAARTYRQTVANQRRLIRQTNAANAAAARAAKQAAARQSRAAAAAARYARNHPALDMSNNTADQGFTPTDPNANVNNAVTVGQVATIGGNGSVNYGAVSTSPTLPDVSSQIADADTASETAPGASAAAGQAKVALTTNQWLIVGGVVIVLAFLYFRHRK